MNVRPPPPMSAGCPRAQMPRRLASAFYSRSVPVFPTQWESPPRWQPDLGRALRVIEVSVVTHV